MSIIFLISLLLLSAALVWSLVRLIQFRDRRVLFLTGMLGLMLGRQILKLLDDMKEDLVLDVSLRGHLHELPDLGLSIMAFLGVMFMVNFLRLDQAPQGILATRRLATMALLVGVLTILACVVVGYWAYAASRDRMIGTIAQGNLSLAKRLSIYSAAEAAQALSPEFARQSLTDLWGEAEPPYAGSYLCLIEPPGTITVHTKVSKAVGRDVQSVRLGGEEAETVGQLLSRRGDWSGANINARGLPQLVGYASYPGIDGLVVVHTPLALVEADLRAAATPWAVGMALIGGLLVPLLLGMLHSSYAVEQRRLRLAEEHRKQMEDEMRHNQRMEALGRLAGGVAHDFNNLLTSVIGNVELARMSMDGSDGGEEIRANLVEIEQAGQQAARLTQQLLAFSRKKEFNLVTLDLNHQVAELDQMLKRLLGEDVQIALDLDPGIPFIRGDSGLIEQIVINLAVNARDAMPDGGLLTIRTHGGPLHPAVLEISDTGLGMEAAVAERIFEPFFTTKSHGNGTGLGLATVYGNVQKLHGRIEVESSPGKGSVFSVYLPAGEGEAMRTYAGTAAAPAPRGSGQLILLCEDDASVRSLTATMLTQAGYEVISAVDGEAAFDQGKAHGSAIQLLLTDVILPDTDGHIVAQRLREEQVELKVLYMSGYTGEDLRDRDFPHEHADLLNKPFGKEELLTRVSQALQGVRLLARNRKSPSLRNHRPANL